MSVTTNEATGEVTAVIGGNTLRLRATMARVSDYQSALNTTGIAAIEVMLRMNDARAVYHGLRCLASPDDAQKADDLLLTPNLGEAVEAVCAALAAGLPEPEEDAGGNAPAAGESGTT